MALQQNVEKIVNLEKIVKDVLEREVAAQKIDEKKDMKKNDDEKKQEEDGESQFKWAKVPKEFEEKLQLKFDGTKVEKIGNYTGEACFSFLNAVDDSMGNVFNLTIKFTKLSWYGTMFGFSTMSKGGIKKYDQSIGKLKNKKTSYGFCINTKITRITMYGPDDNMTDLKYRAKEKWTDGVVLKMSYDFKADELKIYHGDVHAETIKLNGIKTILPAFTLSTPADQIEIMQYEIL